MLRNEKIFVLDKLYHETQLFLNYIRCNIYTEMPNSFHLRTKFQSKSCEKDEFSPIFCTFLYGRIFGRLAETFGAEYSADLAENFGRIFGFGRTLAIR